MQHLFWFLCLRQSNTINNYLGIINGYFSFTLNIIYRYLKLISIWNREPSYSSIKFVLLSWLDSCRWISASNVQADRPSSCYLGVKSASLVAIYQLPEELATLPRSNGSDSMNSWRISLAFLLSLFLSLRCNHTCGIYWECGTSKWTWGMMHRRAVATFN